MALRVSTWIGTSSRSIRGEPSRYRLKRDMATPPLPKCTENRRKSQQDFVRNAYRNGFGNSSPTVV
jgi:hypothetical protein